MFWASPSMEILQSLCDPLPLSDHPHREFFCLFFFFSYFIHDFLRSVPTTVASCRFAVQLLEESRCSVPLLWAGANPGLSQTQCLRCFSPAHLAGLHWTCSVLPHRLGIDLHRNRDASQRCYKKEEYELQVPKIQNWVNIKSTILCSH